MAEIILNPSQKQALAQLKLFVKQKSINTFVLNGFAGTGKTFLMQRFTSYLITQKKEFLLLATTGRAASVLKGKTKFEAKTVHSATYNFSEMAGAENVATDENKHHGQLYLSFTINSTVPNQTIIIVDEASLMSNLPSGQNQPVRFGSGFLLNDFLKTHANCKIIFVGDPAQLPPVGDFFSPALSIDVLNSLGRLTIGATLNQIMRTNNDNDILKVAESIRGYLSPQEQLFSNENYKKIHLKIGSWPKIEAKKKNNITVFPLMNELFEYYIKAIDEFGQQNVIAITGSNSWAVKLNNRFRSRKFGNDIELHIGDILLVSQNNYLVPLTNGDFVEVLEIIDSHNNLGMKFTNIRLKVITSGIEYQILVSMDSLIGNKRELLEDQQQSLMKQYAIKQNKLGIKMNSKQFRDGMMTDKYLNSLKCSFGYFVTCHKAQGGEWDRVFVFTEKAMRPYPNHVDHIKWWYTALTRAKSHVYLSDGYWIK